MTEEKRFCPCGNPITRKNPTGRWARRCDVCKANGVHHSAPNKSARHAAPPRPRNGSSPHDDETTEVDVYDVIEEWKLGFFAGSAIVNIYNASIEDDGDAKLGQIREARECLDRIIQHLEK